MTRLWITGCGAVTALGVGVEATWTRLVRGERAIGPVDLFDTTGYRATIGAEVRGELPKPAAHARARVWSRTTAMAVASAREALARAKLDGRPLGPRAGLVVGGTVGGMLENEQTLARFYAEPSARAVLDQMLTHPLTSTGDALEEALGPFARVRTLSSACSGGANALVTGALWLLAGHADVVLAGASDALCRLTFSGFNALGAIDPEACRPFDARRRGLSLGEGAAFVVLEREEHARARGAEPVAELAGWAIGSEAHHITNPEPTGATPARLLRAAVSRAGLTPEQIAYVNAHGTGTPLNDAMETRAIRDAFGGAGGAPLVSSSKGQIGHTLAAAGAIEAVITALAVSRKIAPPTGGLEQPDPECALAHVMGEGQRRSELRAAVSSSFGFGGMDAVIVVTEPGLGRPHATRARPVVVTGGAVLTAREVLAGNDAARLLGAGAAGESPAPRLELDPGAALDAARARRLDRPARVATLVVSRALAAASLAGGERAGVVLGTAYSAVDGSCAYMDRLFSKGPRLASPADFPNLVPSSPVGHASIYLGLRGPSMTVADLASSGESAIAQAIELVATGEADQVVGGALEETNDIVERVFVAMYARGRRGPRAPRSEGSGAIVIEAEEAARARGAAISAKIEQSIAWRAPRADGASRVSVLRAPLDASRALVVAPAFDEWVDDVLGGTPWAACARADVAHASGDYEAIGAIAAAAAAAAIARGDADEVLVVRADPARGYALLLVRP